MEEVLSTAKNTGTHDFTRAIMSHVVDTVNDKIIFMEKNPMLPEPEDYKAYPGKMDHASCICIYVDDYQTVGYGPGTSLAVRKKEGKGSKKLFSFTDMITSSISSSGLSNSGSGSATTTTTTTNSKESNIFRKRSLEILENLKDTSFCRFDPVNSLKLKSPNESKLVSHGEDVACWAISTYPNIGNDNDVKRLLDPITEFYNLSLYPHRHVCVLTGGCKYGSKAQNASTIACTSASKFLEKKQIKISTAKQAANYLLKSIAAAHSAILQECDNFAYDNEVVIFCGMACRLPDLETSSKSSWLFVCANLGNNRAFYWSNRNQKLTEITSGLSNQSNPGGRIGAVFADGSPDLSNLKVFYQSCEDDEKDIIIIVSPVIYQNFDAQYLGLQPKDIGVTGIRGLVKKWEKVPFEKREADTLARMEKVLVDLKKKTAQQFVNALTENCFANTHQKRNFLSANPNLDEMRTNKSFIKMPGMMGHGTCIAFRVAQLVTPSATSSGLAGDKRSDDRDDIKNLLRGSDYQPLRHLATKDKS
eukprot:TRINITY_DN1506_c2_g1_i4.p1 TRINITY_DN1506_c2_g1~~TRINITY_DN1506_c2_g1_i4.p1  ORF type:complete len:585 (-),score=172.32 TRINITY_DN1506_c2_g1_i4:151-1746(-)